MVCLTNVFVFAIAVCSAASAAVLETRAPPAALVQIDVDVKNITTALKKYDGTSRGFLLVASPAYKFRQDIAAYNNTLAASTTLPAAQCADIIAYFNSPIDADVKAQVVEWDNNQARYKAAGIDVLGRNYVTNFQLDFNNLFKNVCRLCPSGCAAAQKKINDDYQVAINYYATH